MSKKNLTKKNLKIKVNKSIYLKILILEDISESYVSWLNDYEVTKFTEQKQFKHTFNSTKDFVNQKFFSKNDLLFGIYVEGLHIGNIKLGSIKFEQMSGEISYFIGEKMFWGKGIISKCIGTLIQYASLDLGLKKITAGYYVNNINSAKVLKKCGFVVVEIKHAGGTHESQPIKSVLVEYIRR